MTRAILRASIPLAAALALAGCLKPNPLAEQMNQADAGDGDTGEGDPGDGDPGDGDPGDGDGDPGDGDPGDGDGDPGDGDGDPGDGDGDPGDGDGESGDGDPMPVPDLGDGGQSCEPLDLPDMGCAACLADLCCPETYACAEAEGCPCLVDCTLDGGSAGFCKNECGPKPEDVPAVGGLVECANSMCADEC